MSVRSSGQFWPGTATERPRSTAALYLCALTAVVFFVSSCSPTWYRREADRCATGIIERERAGELGYENHFTVERPIDTLRRRLMIDQDLPVSSEAGLGSDQLEQIPYWPEADYPPTAPPDVGPPEPALADVLTLSLLDSLQIAARNSREYQTRKENVYQAALAWDLADDEFRNTFAGALTGLHVQNLTKDAQIKGTESSAEFDWTKKLKSGTVLTAGLALDLANLITNEGRSSFGILADATLTIPLMRGAGRHIVTEPLTQAQRDVVYSLFALERFKRVLAVRVASEYLSVLRQADRVMNQLENYERLAGGTQRMQRLAEAGRLPEIEVDQARQDALRARDTWIVAQQTYAQRLDQFKITLGLPTDALIELDREELQHLADAAADHVAVADAAEGATTQSAEVDGAAQVVPASYEDAGPLELPATEAIEIALTERLDLQTSVGQVYDAQRKVVVAANALEMGLELVGTGQAGSRRAIGTAGLANAALRPEHGVYTFGLNVDLPLERTAEQNAYRDTYISLERSVRSVQELEDQIKLEVRDALRTLLQARESYRIQIEAAELADVRVESTALFLKAGRAQVRDVLEAQQALVDAQNALTAALVDYRVAELSLQRDMGVLQVDDDGLWHEFDPTTDTNDN